MGSWIIFILLVFVVIGLCIASVVQQNKERLALQELFRADIKAIKEYEEIKSQGYLIRFTPMNGYSYAAKIDNYLYFIPDADDKRSGYSSREDIPSAKPYLLIKINIDDITYYHETGDRQVYSTVSGGGSSLGGAAVGGILAGGVGAIIGGRKKVTSTTHVDDTRQILLHYIDNGVGEILYFDVCSRNALAALIPEKDINYINMFGQKQQ